MEEGDKRQTGVGKEREAEAAAALEGQRKYLSGGDTRELEESREPDWMPCGGRGFQTEGLAYADIRRWERA